VVLSFAVAVVVLVAVVVVVVVVVVVGSLAPADRAPITGEDPRIFEAAERLSS